jgi:hypothetical protein
MNIKRTTIIFVGGVALVAWLSAAMTPGRAPIVSTVVKRAPIDAKGAALAGEIARLHERLRPDTAPRQAGRNPFVFRSPSSSSRTDSSAQAASATDASAVVANIDQPRLRLSLAGVAEDPDPAGGAPVRTAIIAGSGQLFLAKEGDTVTDRDVQDVAYKVGKISADSAELIDPRDGAVRRLTLK